MITPAIAPQWRALSTSGHREPTPAENAATTFWHARMVRGGVIPPLPQLADLQALARAVRVR